MAAIQVTPQIVPVIAAIQQLSYFKNIFYENKHRQ